MNSRPALPDRRSMPELCVNIDHVATVRQARRTYEPDPVEAAVEAEAGGADGITVHLREDRRHIQDADLPRLKAVVRTKLNLEMAATDEMIAAALGGATPTAPQARFNAAPIRRPCRGAAREHDLSRSRSQTR